MEKKSVERRLGILRKKDSFLIESSKKGDCWEWIGGKDKKGNPVVNLGKGKCVAAWKHASRILNGLDPGSKRNSRACSNPLCVNPDHFIDEYQRLMSRLVPGENGCLLWTAGKDWDGYGIGWLNGKQGRVTRLLWEKEHGPIPPGMQVCHTCESLSCCAVSHLVLKAHKGREQKGDADKATVLNEAIVVRAREMRRSGATFPEIVNGLCLCVTEEAVSRAVYGTTWKHVNLYSAPVEKK